MRLFLNTFVKTFAIFISIASLILIVSSLLIFTENRDDKFRFLYGDKNSDKIIAILELNGIIIEKYNELQHLTNPFIISPSEVNSHLNNLKQFSPEIIIFSINSPGGTVSASKKLYDIIKDYKKNNNVEIFFHTSELLASGGYWAATSADEIYANYGAIIGSIGVRGPDWFFYDQPKKISTGIFGNSIETKNKIQIFSNIAGKSKDILNPFRKPRQDELNHLKKMVEDIYYDFIRIVSKERKIESNILVNEIGALIYNSTQASQLHLINGESSINQLIAKKAKKRGFEKYKVIKTINTKNSLIKELLTGNFNNFDNNILIECLSLRSSISAILSFEATGC